MSNFRKASDHAAAAWIVERTRGFAENIGSLVPHGFQSYGRVLHPAGSGYPNDAPVTWQEIAESTGRVVHPQVQWPHVAFIDEVTDINQLQDPPPGARWGSPPDEGSLDSHIAGLLAEVLRRHTTVPERCWFAVWEGWGGMRPDLRTAPTFELPSRRYFLLEGPIDAITETTADLGYQSASLWWPHDHGWCVATDVDLESTYVGGTEACVSALVEHPELEAIRADVTDGVTWAADTINPNPLRLDT